MIVTLRIPQLSANVEEAALTAWLKQEGDTVRKGDPVVELTTEKACFECDAPADGVVRKHLAQEKSVLPVGYIIALIGDADAELPDVAAENEETIAAQTTHTPRRRQRRRRKTAERGEKRRVRATPAARRVARELGLELSELAAVAGDAPVSEAMVRAFAKGRSEEC